MDDILEYPAYRHKSQLSKDDRITIDYLDYRRRCYRRIRLVVPQQAWQTGQTFTVTFPDEPVIVESEESWLL